MSEQANPTRELGTEPWTLIEHFRDSKGCDSEADRQRRKREWTEALANARPENPADWQGREFIGELPTTVYYTTDTFGEIGVTCLAPGRYRLVLP